MHICVCMEHISFFDIYIYIYLRRRFLTYRLDFFPYKFDLQYSREMDKMIDKGEAEKLFCYDIRYKINN